MEPPPAEDDAPHAAREGFPLLPSRGLITLEIVKAFLGEEDDRALTKD